MSDEPRRVRTKKGDAFLARYGSVGAAGMLTDPAMIQLLKNYREKVPSSEKTDEEVIDTYARYLASKPREARS